MPHEIRELVVDGVRLRVALAGSGPPLVFIHGFPLAGRMWSAQLAALGDRWQVIAPDLRGFGGSQATPGTVGMRRFADDVIGLLEALGIGAPIHLAGLSMGGYVAWQLWRHHAPRLRSLILCDTKAAADAPQAAQARAELAARAVAEGPQAVVDAMLGRLLAPLTLERRRPVVDAVREMMLAADPQGIAAALRGMAQRDDATAWLPQLALPTLLMVGAADAISPPDEMRGMAQAIRGARLVEIAEAGHLAPLENPEPVNAALRLFLEEVEA